MREIQKLHGKTALITDGESSVRLAIARRFAEEGASAFTMHPDDPEFATEIEAVGENVVWIKGDVSTATGGRRLAPCL